jgi:DNA-binding CsgD family transcriptional regulator
MVRLPATGLKRALDFMIDVAAARRPATIVRCVVEGLPRLVDSEVTTLSVCDLAAGTRKVVSFPENAIGAEDQACFNRLIHEHPLVRFHSTHPDGGACRISDCVPRAAFERQAIFGEYYARIGIDHAIAVPVIANSEMVMSYVLNRKQRDFSDGERGLLDALRPALANLYRMAMMSAGPAEGAPAVSAHLTVREREVLRWVAAGKSDLQIAEILGASVRTVQKHLENAYVKLGVENRTAAAMRFESFRKREAGAL